MVPEQSGNQDNARRFGTTATPFVPQGVPPDRPGTAATPFVPQGVPPDRPGTAATPFVPQGVPPDPHAARALRPRPSCLRACHPTGTVPKLFLA
jgi:hypothetical protein